MRVPRRPRRAVPRAEEGRRLPLRDHRPGDDPVPRWRSGRPDAILYVVDHRQSLHFEQLFETAKLWGYDHLELTHVAFGTVLGEDGKPYKTRSGSAVGLMGLLDEAVDRAMRDRREEPDPRNVRGRAGARSPSGSASARSSTPTSPTTARATTRSATTRCSR